MKTEGGAGNYISATLPCHHHHLDAGHAAAVPLLLVMLALGACHHVSNNQMQQPSYIWYRMFIKMSMSMSVESDLL